MNHFWQLKIEAHIFVYGVCRVCDDFIASLMNARLLQTHAKQWIVLDLLWDDYETKICADEYFRQQQKTYFHGSECVCAYHKGLSCFTVHVHTHQTEMNLMINLRKWKRIASIVKSNVCHFKCFYDAKALQRHRWI